MRPVKKKILLLCLVSFFVSAVAFGQTGDVPSLGGGPAGQSVARPLLLIFVLLGMAILPFVIMMTTSFVKIAVVLALIRNALGTQQIPPNPIVTGLAMILTIYIMIPVGIDIYKAAGKTIQQGSNQPILSEVTVNLMVQALKEGREPLREFLVKHAHGKERDLFVNLARKMRKPEDREQVLDKDFEVVIPAFVISELAEAFQIGFIIFLPFLVIDIVVTNILLSLGMFQISPITISLPFKLLLFVLVNGWHLIAKGLILGYT